MDRKKLLRKRICCLAAAGCLAVCTVQAGASVLNEEEVLDGSRSMEVGGYAQTVVVSDSGLLEDIRIETVETERMADDGADDGTQAEGERGTEMAGAAESEAGASRETGTETEAGTSRETGTETEAGASQETGTETEAGASRETGTETEAGASQEAGMEKETGASWETETETESETETETETETESPIDFEALWQTNTDIYAWIRMPGTVIDYPILQSLGEEDFYLTHDIEGNEDIYGSIYTQRYNSTDFSDFHTILYGHNMKDDTMFGWLSELASLDVLWDHNVIYIYLPDRTLEYWVFAAYVADNLHQLGGVDTRSRADRQAYLDKVEARCADVGIFDQRLFDKITADSHILTLSTCYQNDPEHRFLVQAVLVEQPDPGTLPEMEKPETRPEPKETEQESESELTPAETEQLFEE